MNGFQNLEPVVHYDAQDNSTMEILDPERANQWEVGVKGSLDRVSLTASYYNIRVSNKTMADPANIKNVIQGGVVKSRGVEVNLIANPFTGLNMIAGYSHNYNKIAKDAADGDYLGLRSEDAGPADMIVYIPLFTLVGIEGKMFRPMAMTVFFAILGAFILSLTYVPMASALFLSKKTEHKRNISDRMMEKLNNFYRPIITRSLNWSKTLIVSMIVLFGVSLFVFSRMGGEFIPSLEEGDFAAEISMAQGTSLTQMIKSCTQAEKILKSRFPEVKQAVTRIGSSEIPTDPMLRTICNQAVRLRIATLPAGLFDDVFTGTDTSEKRAVAPSCISQLREVDLSRHPHLELARDIFLLSFYLRGIPFVDLVRLRRTDVNNGVLRYRRSKTGRLLTVKIEPCAGVILKKYTSRLSGSLYLFPVITDSGFSGYRQYQTALRRYNAHLGELSQLLRLKVKLTSYVARHSWATAAYHQGIPVSIISESLGHEQASSGIFNLKINYQLFLSVIGAAVLFGLSGFMFSEGIYTFKAFMNKYIKWKYGVPFIGGGLIILFTLILGTDDYLGLGVITASGGGNSLVNAFKDGGVDNFSWFWKLAFTVITLSTGFKGGEVTPLFFIGATLGNVIASHLGMFWLSDKWVWTPMYIFIAVLIVWHYKKKGLLIILFIGLTITLCDQISSHLIKNLVERLRPSHDKVYAGKLDRRCLQDSTYQP